MYLAAYLVIIPGKQNDVGLSLLDCEFVSKSWICSNIVKKNCIVCTKYLKCFMLFDNFLIMFIKCVHFNAASINSLIAKLLYSFQNV